MSDLKHECGIAAVYHLPGTPESDFAPPQGANDTSRLIPRILLDIQNRGQLAAGITSFNAKRNQLIDTYKDLGSVSEVFRLNHEQKSESIMKEYAGPAAIGHVRYATCGKEDRSYSQPFERHHLEKSKWFSFGFNGQLANYPELSKEIISQADFHLSRETDTEIIMHLISQAIAKNPRVDLLEIISELSEKLDGAYNIVFLNSKGNMMVARDPLGIRPLCYAFDGSLFAAASESVALANLGFPTSTIKDLPPGCAAIIEDGQLEIKQYVAAPSRSHCFFEWIYFANMASRLDDQSVYLVRKRLGEELAEIEDIPLDDHTIVVPVPDTAKGAAASMAHRLKLPLMEGLLRNRYSGRTFIESKNRKDKARMKYTPLPEVLAGKKVLLIEDSIVRSTTMRALISQLRERGQIKEVHVRVACPPIIGPCFYGIDMSTIGELFAPKFMNGSVLSREHEKEMAKEIGADSLRYLPVEAISRSVNLPASSLCQACIDAKYPTEAGRKLYKLALKKDHQDGGESSGRTYDT